MRAKSLPIRHAARAVAVCAAGAAAPLWRGWGRAGAGCRVKTRTPQKPELYSQNAIMYTRLCISPSDLVRQQ